MYDYGKEAQQYFLRHLASVVVPLAHDDQIWAIIMLGEKGSNALYSESDLNALAIIAVNGALAIENAIFYEESRKDWTQGRMTAG